MMRFIQQFLPFVLLGMALIALTFVTILFLYLLVFGAAIGFILYTISYIRRRFFASKQIMKTEKKKSGITIDHQN